MYPLLRDRNDNNELAGLQREGAGPMHGTCGAAGLSWQVPGSPCIPDNHGSCLAAGA